MFKEDIKLIKNLNRLNNYFETNLKNMKNKDISFKKL